MPCARKRKSSWRSGGEGRRSRSTGTSSKRKSPRLPADTHHYGIEHLFIFWKGGTALCGGGVLALVTYVLYTHWQKLDFWRTADLLTPPTFLFVFCARIGCLLAGCCYGRESGPDFPFALPTSPPTEPLLRNLPLYPTQPAFATSALLIFLVLWTRRKRKKFDGEIALIGTLLFSVTSFVIEFYRGDPRILYQILGTEFSQNQVISVSVFVASAILYWYLRRESRASQDTAPP